MNRDRHLGRAGTFVRTALIVFCCAFSPIVAGAQITQAEYATRRAALTSRVNTDGVYLVLGGPEPKENYDKFWQAQNFRYMTGFLEPGSALVIVRKDGKDRAMLFVAPKDPAQEVWTGERLGVKGVQSLGMEGRDASTLRAVLDSTLAGGAQLFAVGDFSRGGVRRGTANRDEQGRADSQHRLDPAEG